LAQRGEKSMLSLQWSLCLALSFLTLPANRHRTDNHGDPLPAGALRRWSDRCCSRWLAS